MANRKRLVLLQSNYIPWKGYFDLIAAADEFVIFDEVQFTKNDWRNRNRITLNGKLHWLTIAIKTSGAAKQSIQSATVSGPDWSRVHWETLRQAYRKTVYFDEIAHSLENAYSRAAALDRLTEINELFLRTICEILGITTKIIRGDIVERAAKTPTQRIVEICKERGATEYLSGPAARVYLEEDLLRDAGLTLQFADYSDYPIYTQQMPNFEHGVSIVDALFQCGAQTTRSMLKSMRVPDGLILAEGPKIHEE
jgi:hypothetical protein